MQDLINHILPYYRDLRRQIHTFPELRYEEKITASLVKRELQKIGLTVQTGIGQTGVVAVLDSGNPGKTIGLRADMDALPITENTGLMYQSQHPGKMHACGHDGHVATLLGVAHILHQQKHQLRGKVKFIFQPAEEGGAGAKAMIEDGVLENPTMDAIFAYHNYPGIPTGTILVRPGCTMYGNTEFSIMIYGKGGHAALPEWTINPIAISAEIIQYIRELMLDFAEDLEPSVITITQIQSGIATNVIPDVANLGGTIRASSANNFQEVKKRLAQKLQGIAQHYSAVVEITFKEIYPPTINTVDETEFVYSQAIHVLGEENVNIKPSSGRASEDFSFFLEKVPGCYFFIGNGEDSASCHSSKYNFNDELLPYAMKLLSMIAIKYLNG
ncbi:MAG: hypothetical protein BGO43_15025 [Gammaproteobacteria bacterium 39-13]|nr:amidohydrolase [Gammaproteobacteria bacterium]OJV86251.1 MAG: hypothetical protein BGO43_15025 [Gammaproteobacteria bacterium 39-13]